MTLAALEEDLRRGADEQLLAGLAHFEPGPAELERAAALALQAGRPRLAAGWWARARRAGAGASAQLGLAAALCRLGDAEGALEALRDEPGGGRAAVLRARARQLLGEPDLGLAQHARARARAEGDVQALIAAATLLGELLVNAGDGRAALHALAEGLKVAELSGHPADAHLLAVLSRAQAAVGSPHKARATAEKALARSLPRSPARVAALLALGHREAARLEALAGELVLADNFSGA